MKALLTATVTAFLLTGGAGYAQTTVVISPEQETVIREYVVEHQVEPVAPPADVTIEVGTTLPDTIELHPLEAPDLEAEYRYVVVDGRTVLVEPETRRIVHIIQ
ncbi:DUF1236 domain-containing protein [Chelativorans sp. AA-79]|uniref:DUF1236 domain-containing protein n=1 Tax=Chelativorans sp. AA-79 TaxID=3028735 RepID=UPI0023F8CC16|nr:DUF1236 domain-containing protein [Chelativorans sp. AA-79]WEX11628.1 DUF1236 domain-containing protein [Chelativorans sp. AA-79]